MKYFSIKSDIALFAIVLTIGSALVYLATSIIDPVAAILTAVSGFGLMLIVIVKAWQLAKEWLFLVGLVVMYWLVSFFGPLPLSHSFGYYLSAGIVGILAAYLLRLGKEHFWPH